MIPHRRSPLGRRPSRRPRFESLESRQLLTTFKAHPTGDGDVTGTLRAAILAADADAGPGVDEIDLAFGGHPEVISPTTPLPVITRPVS